MDSEAVSGSEGARRSLARADTVAYYAHRRYRELRTAESLEEYEIALKASAEAMRQLVAAEGEAAQEVRE